MTLFLHYEKADREVKSVMAIMMKSLVDALHLNSVAREAVQHARTVLKPEKASRLNFQSRLTVDELRTIAEQPPNFVIPTHS